MTYIKCGTEQVVFPYKPICDDYFDGQILWAGSKARVIDGSTIVQRFQRTTTKGREMKVVCPYLTYENITTLINIINADANCKLKLEDDGQEIDVTFNPGKPFELIRVGGDYPDEDKKNVGLPWNRYNVTLYLIEV